MAAEDDELNGPLPEGAAPYGRAQKALLTVVVTVGLLIIAGVGVVIFTIVNRLGKLSDTPKPAAEATAKFTMPAASLLALPAGAVVEETSLDGDRLAVRYRSAAGGGIVIYDLGTGKTIGTVTLAQ